MEKLHSDSAKSIVVGGFGLLHMMSAVIESKFPFSRFLLYPALSEIEIEIYVNYLLDCIVFTSNSATPLPSEG